MTRGLLLSRGPLWPSAVNLRRMPGFPFHGPVQSGNTAVPECHPWRPLGTVSPSKRKSKDILGSQQEESWAVLGLWSEAHHEGEW